MSTSPQPPRPPVPPPAPRTGSNIVAIVLLVLSLIVVVAAGAVWIGVRFITHEVHVTQHEGPGGKQVSIQTPVGSLEVRKEAQVSPVSLGLPFYPGAEQIHDDQSATFDMSFFGAHRVRILVAKFRTSDASEKVRQFYLSQLTNEMGRFVHKDHMDMGSRAADWNGAEGNFIGTDREGRTVLEIKRKDDLRIVALKDDGNGTRIDLLHIAHGTNQAN